MSTVAPLLPPATPALRRDGNFQLYLGARVISQLGDQLYVFAISWFVLDLTKSSVHMAALLAINSLALTAMAPVGGLVADRVSRKAILVITDVIQGIVLLGLFALGRGHLLSLGVLYAGTVILGVCAGMFSPAAGAIIPGIVRRELVPAAVAASQAAANFCTIAGMLLGGLSYSLFGISGVLLVNGVSFLVAAGMEGKLRVDRGAAAPGAAVPRAAVPATASGHKRAAQSSAPGITRGLLDGLRHVRADREVFTLLVVNTVFNFVGLPIAMVYMPYLFNVMLKAAPSYSAFPQAAIWAGIIAGSAAVAGAARRRRPETLIGGGLIALAAGTAFSMMAVILRNVLGVLGTSVAFTASNFVAGAAVGVMNVPLYALFHARTVDEFRGRFWGLENALRTAAVCLGFFAAGAIAQRLPLAVIFAYTGVVTALLGAVALRTRSSPMALEDGTRVSAETSPSHDRPPGHRQA